MCQLSLHYTIHAVLWQRLFLEPDFNAMGHMLYPTMQQAALVDQQLTHLVATFQPPKHEAGLLDHCLVSMLSAVYVLVDFIEAMRHRHMLSHSMTQCRSVCYKAEPTGAATRFSGQAA